jgi:hypothetical protein
MWKIMSEQTKAELFDILLILVIIPACVVFLEQTPYIGWMMPTIGLVAIISYIGYATRRGRA